MTETSAAVGMPTRDPFTNEPLIVTRLQNPSTGTAFEGRFALGWLGRVTQEQLDFIGLLLARRNNLQKLAADLGIAYNTARGRFEEIVRALGGATGEDDRPHTPGSDPTRGSVREILQQLADGTITSEEADRLLGR